MKMNQPVVVDNSNLNPPQPVTTKTVKLPLSMTFSGKRA